MTRIALVTGSKADMGPVAEALEKAGLAVSRAALVSDLEALAHAIAPGTLDCYVQLPFESIIGGQNTIERAAQFLAGGIVARYEAAAAALPLLKPDACVILIEGEAPPEGAPDDAGARRDLLKALCRAIPAGVPGGEVKSVIMGEDHSAEEIAHMAVQRGEDRLWLHSQVRSLPAGLSYADWRNEMIGLS